MTERYNFNGIPDCDSAAFGALVAFCVENRTAVLAQLPWVAAEIAADVGFGPMLQLVQAAGGQRLSLTEGGGFAQRLRVPLSREARQRILGLNHAIGYVELPSAWGVFLAIRRAAILDELGRGRPQREIASDYGVTMRTLRKLRGNRPDVSGTGPHCEMRSEI